MNKNRRKEIGKIRTELENLLGRIEVVRDEEQEYFDNMPESLQDGEKGEAAQTASEALDNAFSTLEEVISSLEEAEGV